MITLIKLLIGEKYELEKKLERHCDRSPETGQFISPTPQNEPLDETQDTHRTADRIAKEQGVSRATVERSADLYLCLMCPDRPTSRAKDT